MRTYRRKATRGNPQRVPSDAEIADAFRSIFGSKAEVDEMFAEFEAKLVRAVNEVYGPYKEARDAEWGLARVEEPPAADRSAAPVLKVT
jgi:hypothetical protein